MAQPPALETWVYHSQLTNQNNSLPPPERLTHGWACYLSEAKPESLKGINVLLIGWEVFFLGVLTLKGSISLQWPLVSLTMWQKPDWEWSQCKGKQRRERRRQMAWPLPSTWVKARMEISQANLPMFVGHYPTSLLFLINIEAFVTIGRVPSNTRCEDKFMTTDVRSLTIMHPMPTMDKAWKIALPTCKARA